MFAVRFARFLSTIRLSRIITVLSGENDLSRIPQSEINDFIVDNWDDVNLILARYEKEGHGLNAMVLKPGDGVAGICHDDEMFIGQFINKPDESHRDEVVALGGERHCDEA